MKCNLPKPMSDSAFRKFQNERIDAKCCDCGVLLYTTSFSETMTQYMYEGKKALDKAKHSRCEECELTLLSELELAEMIKNVPNDVILESVYGIVKKCEEKQRGQVTYTLSSATLITR